MSFCLMSLCPLRVTGCVASFGVVDNYLPFHASTYIVNLLYLVSIVINFVSWPSLITFLLHSLCDSFSVC